MTGRPSPWADNPDYVPTVFSKRGDKRRKKKGTQRRKRKGERERKAGCKSKPKTFQSTSDGRVTDAAEILLHFSCHSEGQDVDQGDYINQSSLLALTIINATICCILLE